MFCVFFLFRFSMIITGDRKQMAFSVHWKLYDHCCVRVDFSLLLRYSSKLIIQLEKKYSFPIFGCWRIPAWRNGSWFRTYLIGFSQEEINEQCRPTKKTILWWVGLCTRNPIKKWVKLKLNIGFSLLTPWIVAIKQNKI